MIPIPILIRKDNTTGNYGDNLIVKGFQNLLSEDKKYLEVDKFSQKDFEDKLSLIKEIGYIYFVGTPQYNNYNNWYFWWDKELFEIAKKNNIKVISIAGGSGEPSLKTHFLKSMKEEDINKYIMSLRKEVNPTLTVRDSLASKLLKMYDINHTLLPCTALFSLAKIKPKSDHLILSLPGFTHYDKANNNNVDIISLVNKFKKIYHLAEKDGHKVYFGFPGIDSAKGYESFLKGYNYFVPTTIKDWQIFLAEGKGSISCRIHVSIPMQYFPNKKNLITGIDSRILAAKEAACDTYRIIDSPEKIYNCWKKTVNSLDIKTIESKYQQFF